MRRRRKGGGSPARSCRRRSRRALDHHDALEGASSRDGAHTSYGPEDISRSRTLRAEKSPGTVFWGSHGPGDDPALLEGHCGMTWKEPSLLVLPRPIGRQMISTVRILRYMLSAK